MGHFTFDMMVHGSATTKMKPYQGNEYSEEVVLNISLAQLM
jgi:hypothetical protein